MKPSRSSGYSSLETSEPPFNPIPKVFVSLCVSVARETYKPLDDHVIAVRDEQQYSFDEFKQVYNRNLEDSRRLEISSFFTFLLTR